jgi:AcrR family transcriptional regulator
MVSSDPIPNRPSRKARTRQAILAAAAGCFRDHGFAGCSVDAIAEAAGVTKPTIYAHFESKEGLFDELLRETFLRVKDEPLPAVDDRAALEAALTTHATRHAATLLDPESLGLLRAVVAELMRRPEWAQELFRSIPEDGLQRWFAAAAKKGLLEIKSPKLATDAFWSLVKGPLFYPVLLGLKPMPGARERNRVLRESVRIFLDAHQP